MHTQYPGLLGLSNIILLIASTILIYLGASLTNFYLLDHLDFVSSYFSLVPYLMIITGVASFVTALYGTHVAVKESRWQLVVYSFFMVVLFCLQLGGIFAAMELRSVINNGEFNNVDVLTDLENYNQSPATREKWDALHREFHCCGGINFNTGYKIWRNADIGLKANSVPDSCCQRQTSGCGNNLFTRQDQVLTHVIYTHGCITVMEEKLRNQVVPILLGYAAVGTILALLQILAIVFACAYSSAISRRNNRKEESIYVAATQMSSPSTPRFDHVRSSVHNHHQNNGYSRDNMSSVFASDSTLDRKRMMMESPELPTQMEEVDV